MPFDALFMLVGLAIVGAWILGRGQIKDILEKLAEIEKELASLRDQVEGGGAVRKPVEVGREEQVEWTPYVPTTEFGPPPTKPVEEEVPAVAEEGVPVAEEPPPAAIPAQRSYIPDVELKAPIPPEKPANAPPPWLASLSKLIEKASKSLVTALMGEEEADWETLIGGRWLNVIGIIVLVVGIALFLGYTLRYYGPLGKVMTGVNTGLALLAIGVFFERSMKYRLFARPLIGGGWALLYFTAYAAHNVEAARIIESPATGLILLFSVAAGIIAHSFKYRSQVVTGLAYGLGFLAVAISPLSQFSLVATGVLAAALLPILRVMPWYHLGLVGVVASYVNHLLWQGLGTGGGIAEVSMESLWLSQGILVFYWLIFVVTAFVRRPQGRNEEKVAFVLNIANTVGFFALSGKQILAVVPDNLYFLAGAGAVAYAATAYLLRVTGQRKLHLFNASIAVLLAAVALPLAIPHTPLIHEWLGVLWVTEAAVVFILGFRLHELILRIEAYLLCLAGLISLFTFNFVGAGADRFIMLTLTVLPVVGFFFWLFEKLPKAAGHEDVQPEARPLGITFGYAATALIAALLWELVPGHWVGVAWLATGVIFFEFGIRTSRLHVRGQAYALMIGAFLTLLLNSINAVGGQLAASFPPLWAMVAVAVLVFYGLFVRLNQTGIRPLLHDTERAVSNAPSYGATILLTVILWIEAGPEMVGLAWLAAGLLLFEWGAQSFNFQLRSQGYSLVTLALGSLFLVNLYGFYGPPEDLLPARLSVVGPAVVAVYALWWRLRRKGLADVLRLRERMYMEAPSYAATALLAVLLWKELNPVEVSLAWAALGLTLFEVGSRLGNRAFRMQGHALAVFAFGRLFMANFTAFGDVIGISHRLLTVLPVAAIFYYLRYQIGEETRLGHAFKLEQRLRPFYSYGAAVALVVLARFEFGRAYAIMGWAPLMVVLLVLGTMLRDRDFRYQSYLLAILTFARSWATSLSLEGTFLGIPERYATSVPAIAALLAAAFYCLWRRRTAQEPKLMEAASGRILRFLNRLEVHSVVLFSFLGSSLVTVLLFYEVSGNLLTMAWTFEALVLTAIGFLVLDRSFRLYGLGLLLVCLIKLVVIDLADVETLYRIFSYIVLGVILLLISLGYTRYRDVIRRYL